MKFGIEQLTREAVEQLAAELPRHNSLDLAPRLREAGIVALVTDVLAPYESAPGNMAPELSEFLGGRFAFPQGWHPVFRPMDYPPNPAMIAALAGLADMDITSLAEYETAIFEIMKRCRERGVVALKDLSAYRRPLSYDLPPRCDAERLFNRALGDPRSPLVWPENKPLEDYLFHQYLRFARELGWPVQLHTGHLNQTGGRVTGANAAHLAPLLELHTRVRFDLFHGNWPYLGDFLFLGKNYPNVRLDLCWVCIVDPLYAIDLLKRAVVTVPHVKIHAFGGDMRNVPEYSIASLQIAREVVAAALADLVEAGWLEEEEAAQVAADWLYNNPNEFYRLGLEPYPVHT